MISRLTALAITIATLATASLAFAASVHQAGESDLPAAAAVAPTVVLERVVIVGKRLPQEAR